MKEHYQLSTILIPIDFSERSLNAVKQTIPLAQIKQAKIICYHSFLRPNTPIDASKHEIDLALKNKRDELMERFDNFCKEVPSLSELEYSFILEPGVATNSVEKVFNEHQVDLLVMATHGAKGEELIYGTKTSHLVSKIKGPMLVLPDASSLTSVKKIALAYDFKNKKQSMYSLSLLKHFAMAFGASIRIIDVRPNNFEKTEERLAQEKQLSLFIGEEIPHDFESIFSSNVDSALYNYVHEYNIDILALMPAERSFIQNLFHESVTQTLSEVMDKPLLTLVDK